MWNKNIFEKSLVIASLSTLILGFGTGCGSAPQPGSIAVPAAPVAFPIAPTVINTPITAPNLNLNGAYNYSFELQNSSMSCNNGGTPTPTGVHVGTFSTPGISTDNIFKVTVSSGSYTTIPCTGYSAVYSCLQYTVTVGSRSETVKVSYGTPQIGSPCDGIPSSATLDFSDQVGPGHGAMTVSVSQVQSDNCRQAGYSQSSGCAMTPLYANYIGTGSLAVVTNRGN
jgi:hypothetical protein